MSRRSENEKNFHAVSYLRLLRFVRPYWIRLAIGILAGFIVGGSLFGSLMLLPNMIMIVDQDSGQREKIYRKSELLVKTLEQDPALTMEEKTRLVSEILLPRDDDPKLTQTLEQLQSYKEKLHLPIEVGKRSVATTWPVECELPIVDEAGRMTWQFFMIYAILFVLAWALKNAATYLNHYCTRWVGARVIADMRDLIYQRLLAQSMRYYGKPDVGHLISRCTNDTAAIESSVSNTIADATRCPIEILACASVIVIVSIRQNMLGMLLVIGGGMPLRILPVFYIAKRIRKIYKKAFANIAEITSRMHETFSGMLLIKANNTEKKEIERFGQVNRKYFRSVIRALRLQLMMSPLMEFVAVTSTLVFLVFAYSRGITISQMVMLLAPAILAYRPIKDLTNVINHLQRSMAAADRYFDIIDTDTSLAEKKDPVEFKEFKSGIEFRDVSFEYEPGQTVLEHVSFTMPRGSMVAVVGETGSGKSTIASLLARLYDVTSGCVLIDGVPVQDYSIKSLRSHIGFVTQEPILFNDTIANNIAYGNANATREQIEQAAKQANAHDFIVDGVHPLGYEEEVGEKGFKLSGGEKQRVAIARTILKNPPILILDEATSALDTVTEKLIQDALTKMMKNRTVFAIAHRLSTIRNADLILVISKGRVVERGTHEELMALGGRYKRLHDVQFSMDQT